MCNEPRDPRPIVAQRQSRGDAARLERRDGELCREVDDLDDVRRRAPRKPAERRSERLEHEAQHTRKGVEHQRERQHGERHECRGEADQRHLLEVESRQRQGREYGCCARSDGSGQRSDGPMGGRSLLVRYPEEALQPVAHRIGERRYPRHGREAQLERNAPKDVRASRDHHRRRESERRQYAPGTAQRQRGEIHGAHDRRPHRRRGQTRQHGVEPDRQQWDDEIEAAPPPEHSRAHRQRQRHQDADVQPRYRQQVRRSGRSKVIEHCVGNGIAHPQQERLPKRRLGLGRRPAQRCVQTPPNAEQRRAKPPALALSHYRDARKGHYRADSLPRQVRRIVEVIQFGRSGQRPFQPQPVAVSDIWRIAVACGLCAPLRRHERRAFNLDPFAVC